MNSEMAGLLPRIEGPMRQNEVKVERSATQSSVHPIVKLLIYIQLVAVSLWGPVPSAAIAGLAIFVYLLTLDSRITIFSNPWLPLGLCLFTFLIAIPGGTRDELMRAAEIAIRLFGIIMSSILLGISFGIRDMIRLSRLLRTPEQLELMGIAVSAAIPRMLESLNNIVLAQRSRGMVFSWRSVFSAGLYHALMTPVIVAVLRTALDLWISLCIRPWRIYRPMTRRPAFADMVLLMASFVLWLDTAKLLTLSL
ncbi:MAG: energy-coupling factor transporter transmembrane component T [Candidatus Thorarchaeota archaeon]